MDRLPTGGGMSGGAAPDGAFERFLTAAIATIITIMFSWRLLAEEEEARGGGQGAWGTQNQLNFPISANINTKKPPPGNQRKKSSASAQNVQPRIQDIDISDDETMAGSFVDPALEIRSPTNIDQNEQELVLYDHHSPIHTQQLEATNAMQTEANLSYVSTPDDSLTVDTLTTWDEYKWEDDAGDEDQYVIKTRRNVRDFLSPNSKSSNSSLNQSDPNESGAQLNETHLDLMSAANVEVQSSPSVPFSQRFANFEYKDTGGDSGYIDLYPDIESDSDNTDSSDDERAYDIQVSDSDSDDEREAGSFYGVTSLDTIMEEYESDVSESDDVIGSCDKEEGSKYAGDSRNVCDKNNETSGESYDTGAHFDSKNVGENLHDIPQSDVNTESPDIENNRSLSLNKALLNFEQNLKECDLDNSHDDQITESSILQTESTQNAICQPLQNETTLKCTEANTVECNLSLDKTHHFDMNTTLMQSRKECDMNVNEAGEEKISPGDNELTPMKNDPDFGNKSDPNLLKADFSHISTQNNNNKPEFKKLNIPEDDYKISEISDDSLPPSPIRTCALDHLIDTFSDTESCSSESVITVLSVKSNDSENRNMDKYHYYPVDKKDQARGDSDLSSLIDSKSETSSKYDNFSLVSGFLNDSLNSLLSANTGSHESETESSSDKEQSGHESSDLDNAGTLLDGLNGKVASDDSEISSQESLPNAQAHGQDVQICDEAAVMNGHTTSSDSLVNPQDQGHGHDEFDGNDGHADSDGASSDSSDPPLREYDPRDDDLAEYHFDSDEDSFFLVCDHNAVDEDDDDHDDGKLRNFETFTNLNSVGLSREYGDAFTSHTVADDASGFTFSRTEDVSTEFRRRGYFTERGNLSDSDARSDEPISPVVSEDEENKQTRESNPIIEPKTSVQQMAGTRISDSYKDAEISITGNDEKMADDQQLSTREPIDFRKYIIQTDLSPISEHVPFTEEMNFEHSPRDQEQSTSINGESLESNKSGNQKSEIDAAGDKSDTLGKKDLNNSDNSLPGVETFSSLTEQIKHLTESDDRLELEFQSSEGVVNSDNSNFGQTRSDSFQNSLKENEDVLQSSNTKETLIDDIVGDVRNERVSEQLVEHFETDLDDVSEVKRDLPDVVPSESKTIETAISKPRTNSRKLYQRKLRSTPTKPSVETNIDDILDETPLKSLEKESTAKVETNIDDIFDDHVTPVITAHVRASPLKQTQSPRKETNIDDILAEVSNTNRETSVDDIVIENYEHDDVKRGDVRAEKTPLTYETFIDDLLENPDQVSSQSHVFSSESAIEPGLAEISDTLPVIIEKGVHVENNNKLEQSPSHCLNNTDFKSRDSLKQNLERNVTDSLSNIEISEIDKDKDKDTQDYKENGQNNALLNSATITSNYPKSHDGLENSNTQHNVFERNLQDDNYVENENSQRTEYEKKDNAFEDSYTYDNLNTNSGQLSRGALNIEQSGLQYDGSNVTLPKTEKLNNSRNSSEIGQTPENNDRYRDNDVGISLEESTLPLEDRLKNTADVNSQDGLNFGDIVLTINDENVNENENDLKIVEQSECSSNAESSNLSSEGLLDSIGSSSPSGFSDDESLSSLEESYHSLQESYSLRARVHSESSLGRVVRTPLTKPSDFYNPRSQEIKGPRSSVKRRIQKQQLKKYSSVLTQPITPEKVHVVVELPDRHTSVTRLKVLKSRERFLSSENLSPSGNTFDDKFLQHRTSLLTSTPRKYIKRHERELQSTESLPTEMSLWNATYGSNSSMEHVHSLPLPSPRNLEELYNSRYSSANSSFERGEFDKLHANCMFSPAKREEIRHTTNSLENMFEQLLRYGSVSSVVETDLDADVNYDYDVSTHAQSFQDPFVSFQYPLERAASMSALVGTGEMERLPRKPGKGRFANRHVSKSKSLQTLETNLDDVFADELEQPGELKKTPSVHELRVSNSLSKLHVPDWFRKSSFSRSGSTQSLFTYAGRQGSTSTIGSCAYPPSITSSPSPSVTPCSNTVIIQKRVTPNQTTPSSARLRRPPMLPVTPERAPIHNTPAPSTLPSDKYRKRESKTLKPITIVPFAKIREMFERKSQEDAKMKSPVTSPTKEKPPPHKVRFEPTTPTKETVISIEAQPVNGHKPVQNERTVSPPPPLPDRKPILADSNRNSESAPPPKKAQVHFSDEPQQVSKSQEQKVESKRQNGATPSTLNNNNTKPSTSTVKKSGFRASLPLPQFRFRRPGPFATKVTSTTSSTTSAQDSSTKSKKETTV
ncbi:uncharacterized protein LOC128223148 [Mya arenaria]|uniref:uncharacterized protein LOC128223148 n=1 Tax=Mya arenaria TaxID=6604 RepID=UPI0022E3C656|nr:uncharacterized protein LOC128223148 [Mya arenaria]